MSKKPNQNSRIDVAERARLEVTFDRPHLLTTLFGQYDRNLVAIENRLGVYIAARGNKLQIEGEAEAAARARDVMTGLYNRIVAGQEIDSGAVEAVIAMSSEPTLDGIIRSDVAEPPKVMIRTRKKTIVPRSATQVTYMEALNRNDIIFALGPAGTGKTYLAVAQAVSQLITGSVDRLILSRPDTLPAEQVERRIASGEIEIAPLAFMRGRTLANAFIVLDEAQNTTIAQMKMFLTRFGEGSRMVICGDPKQVDLPQPGTSGLADAVARLDGVEGIAMVPFGVADVVRHPVVGRIVQAYEGPDA
jgi:phosphate starvation-inducible PhoH-like protein